MNTATLVARPDYFHDQDALRDLLDRWAEQGWLRALDAAFAGMLAREIPDASPLLILAAALTSHQLGRGHACLDLAEALRDPASALSLPPEGSAYAAQDELPPLLAAILHELKLGQWKSALTHPSLVSDGAGNTPLVCIGTRVYLRRYWQYEQDVRAGIADRLLDSTERQQALPVDAMRQALDLLFPAQPTATAADWQKLACALAARSGFSIITGGPGTGKTTTVVKLLALLQTLALTRPDNAQPLRIRLAAPTGKAAARLNESIAGAVARLPLAGLPNAEAVRASIPVEVATLHRLLGSRPDTRHFRHHAGNLLALDVLVVDEASMVDLEMMASVLAALPATARLILLGDKDQLASVEAGSVLGELCRRAQEGHYTPATRDWLQAVTGQEIEAMLMDAAGTAFDQAIAMLRFSHRFSADSGIGHLAAAVNAGSPDTVQKILAQGYIDLATLPLAQDDSALATLVVDGGEAEFTGRVGRVDDRGRPISPPRGYRHYLELLRDSRPTRDTEPADFEAWAQTVLTAHSNFQLLCAVRRGPWGVEGLNQRIAGILLAARLIPASEGWYCGRPVLVTRNDYSLGLMNGDIGIALEYPVPGQGRMLRVAFPSGDGANGIKWVLPSRLQAVETVFALTVHKSQGSEFTHTALVLPDTLSPILTRELIYTGITRAKDWFTLANAGGTRILQQAVKRRVQRLSGLMENFSTGGGGQ